jgi:DNA-binding NtrC family response regulator
MRRKHRLLLVDDDRDWTASIELNLRKEFDVTIKRSVVSAERELARRVFDIVVIDYDFMAGPDGIELVASIRKRNRFLPLVMVSGKIDQKNQVTAAINAGINDYLDKGVNLYPHLAASLDRCLKERDGILLALEEWAAKHAEERILATVRGKTFTARELVDEIKRDSPFGRRQRLEIVETIIDLIAQGRVSRGRRIRA